MRVRLGEAARATVDGAVRLGIVAGRFEAAYDRALAMTKCRAANMHSPVHAAASPCGFAGSRSSLPWHGAIASEDERRDRPRREPAHMTTGYLSFYRGRRVMVTGGLGFIGSNLARQLVDAGADVLIVDSLNPDYGGNRFNIDGIEDRVRVNVADVRDQTSMDVLVEDREVIFNLAGQVSHIDSMRDPYTDLDINCRAQLSMLEACRKYNPGVRVVFAGTRQVYGRPDRLPVDENASRAAGRHQRRQQGGRRVLPSALQQRLRRPRLLAAADQRLRPASADPAQSPGLHRLVHPARDRGRRDPDLRRRLADCATSSTSTMPRTRSCAPARPTRATARSSTSAAIEPISHRELVALLIDVAGSGSVRFVEWPPEKKRIDIGSFYSDSTKFRQTRRLDASGRPARGVRAGRSPSTAQHLAHYVDEPCRRRRSRGRDLVPAADARRGRGRRARGHRARRRRAAGSCSVRSWRRSSGSSRPPVGAAHAVGVGTGTDALAIALRALGIGAGRRGDHVAALGRLLGARDHDGGRAAGVRRHRSRSPDARSATPPPRPSRRAPRRSCRCTSTVRPPTCRAIVDVARRHNLAIVEDCCQAHLATCEGRPVGSFGAAAAYSFYPTKNLGALGDGGALTTSDAALAARAKRLRNGGQTDRYRHDEFGVNSRLDEMQAAILRARLPLLRRMDRAPARARPTIPRGARADRRRRGAAGARRRPRLPPLPGAQRARATAMQAHLQAAGIETLIHYPIPIPRQPALVDRATRRLPDRRLASAARSFRCRSTPRSPTPRSTTSPPRVAQLARDTPRRSLTRS